MTYKIVLLKLVMRIGAVGDCGLPLGGGVRRGSLLQQPIKGQPPVQGRTLFLHSQVWDLVYFMVVQYMQHWRNTRHIGSTKQKKT